jgi:hypothetical protein
MLTKILDRRLTNRTAQCSEPRRRHLEQGVGFARERCIECLSDFQRAFGRQDL